MSAADTTLLTRQREMLLQKLDEFERTNKGLRHLLREHQESEVCKFLYLSLECHSSRSKILAIAIVIIDWSGTPMLFSQPANR